MNIRKLIREELAAIFEQNNTSIKGIEILNFLQDLPQTRDEVNWSNNPRIFYTIPSLENSNAHTEVYDKEFFTGWDRPYSRQGKMIPHKGLGYIAEFEKQFGEAPIFRMNGREIEILNPKFIHWRNKGSNSQDISGLGSLD